MALLKNTVIYTMGGVFNAASGFITIPILTHAISASEFGIYELLTRVSSVLVLFIFLGCRQAYIRYFFIEDTETWRQSVTATMLVFLFVTASIILLLMIMAQDWFLAVFFNGEYKNLYVLMLVWVPVDLFFNLSLAYLMLREKARLYVCFSILKTVIYLILVYLALYVFSFSLEGVFGAQIISAGSIAFCFILYLIWWSKLSASLEILKQMLRFGLPILPTAILSYILMSSDRYFLTTFTDLQQLGIYSLAAKLCLMATLLLQEGFSKVWSPFVFKTYDTPGGNERICRVFESFVFLNIILAFLISIFAGFYIPLLSTNEYIGAVYIAPFCALGYALYSVACLADIGILISKKTEYKILTFGISALVVVISNFIFVRFLGIYGAGISVIIGYVVLLIASLKVSNRFYLLPIKWGNSGKVLLIAILIYAVSLFFIDYAGIISGLVKGTLFSMLFLIMIAVFKLIPEQISLNLLKIRSYLGQRILPG